MRSHSRLDFYAKSLAVAGLGCLGAIGALIDYWPAQGPLPEVAAVAERPGALIVRTLADVSDFSSGAPARISLASMTSDIQPRPVATRPARVRALEPSPVALASLVTESVTLAEPPEVPVVARLLPVTVEVGALHLPVEPATLASAEESWEPTAPSVMAFNQPDDGFLSGVLRKTGSSVVMLGSSITKAGSSLFGAFRFVGGAVRRAF